MKIRPVIYRIQKKALDLASHEFEESGMGGIARYNELFVEKFSELIIEECCNQVPYGYAEMIKEHFGVE